MTLPLYRPRGGLPSLGLNGHRGLWYDKFCDRWRVSPSGPTWSLSATANEKSPKLGWIETIAEHRAGDPDVLDEYAMRTLQLVGGDGWAEVFNATSRFVTGLGRSHPVENGFAWHPTLGTPYLPGSSVKGLILAWARENGEESAAIELLGRAGQVGRVILIDALPLVPVKLEADVLTPHYAGWDEDEPPGDWMAPRPVPFLVAAPGTRLLFGIMRRSTAPTEVERVRGWLVSALEEAGAGAKTAVGYGRFQADERSTQRLRDRLSSRQDVADRARRREEAMSTPLGRWRLELENLAEERVEELVRRHLEAEPLADPVDRQAFAAAVLETGMPTSWRAGRSHTPQGTSTGAPKLKRHARRVSEAAGEGSTDQG